ncbi:AraC family ligand binding domain-containing protein [Cohnella sp. REN36]|nr:AraC family ligand binding domain-containing protein [Cohnella sp. REN36]
MAEHYTHELHRHSFIETCYVTNGDGYYVEDGKRYSLHPGDIFFSRPDKWRLIEGGSFQSCNRRVPRAMAETESGNKDTLIQ